MPGGNSTTESKRASDSKNPSSLVATHGDILGMSAKRVIVLATVKGNMPQDNSLKGICSSLTALKVYGMVFKCPN